MIYDLSPIFSFKDDIQNIKHVFWDVAAAELIWKWLFDNIFIDMKPGIIIVSVCCAVYLWYGLTAPLSPQSYEWICFTGLSIHTLLTSS